MKKEQISLTLARRMALHAQLLDGQGKLPAGKQGVAQAIEKLGYVQIDTIAVVQRAHHHTLWTRCPDYDPLVLHELQAQDRRVFEYWARAASYVPTCDYRYYLPRMREFNDPYSKWERGRLEQFGHLMGPVLERIRQEGPLSSRDFATGSTKGTPRDRNPSKVALEMLFSRGELMVTERRGFEKIYDLAERVLPADVDTRLPDDDEVGQFFARRALSAYGVAQEKEIHAHIDAASKKLLSKALRDLLDDGQVVPLQVQGADHYALAETLAQASQLEAAPPRVSLLSPFDNLIIQRERIKHLFGFDYALECYVTPAKRKHGYFVLPILWGESLVGRLDPKAERKQKTLIIRNLAFEPGFEAFDQLLPAFNDALRAFARFNRCEKITWEKVTPAHLKPTLERL
jgi:uncharacterized protein YcaQ